MSHDRTVIFANGDVPDIGAARRLLNPEDHVICADAGARHARLLGRLPDIVIGDLDSLGAGDQSWLAEARIPIVRYPHDKDATDLELAVQHALNADSHTIVVVGALGSRLDHTLGNIALLADERLAERDASLDDGVEMVRLCRAKTKVSGGAGDIVSLVPWGMPVTGVRTTGLRWPLRGETLWPERSRGISNLMLGEAAEIAIESGRLLVIQRRMTRP